MGAPEVAAIIAARTARASNPRSTQAMTPSKRLEQILARRVAMVRGRPAAAGARSAVGSRGVVTLRQMPRTARAMRK
jgi:hypothetical protein